MEIATLGINLARSIFRFHWVTAAGAVVLQKKLRRGAVSIFPANSNPA